MKLTASDIVQIRQLHSRYCHCVDFGDYDGIAGCFAADGSYGVDGEPNHAAERSGKDMGKSPFARAFKGHARHIVLTTIVNGDGATARSLTPYLMTRDFGEPAGGKEPATSIITGLGIFADDLVKSDRGWVYHSRRSVLNRDRGITNRLRRPLEIPPLDAGPTEAALTPLDHEAIRQQVNRACLTLDLQDHDGFAESFTPDGVHNEIVGRAEAPAAIIDARGHDALRAHSAAIAARGYDGYVRHNLVSSLIEGTGDTANVLSYGLITMCWERAHPWQPVVATLISTGMFQDTMVKREGRWLIARRSFRKDTMPQVTAMIGRPIGATTMAG